MSIYDNPLEALQAYKGQLWTVRGMIPTGGLVRLIGAPQAWKTFLLIKLAVCVANGKPFFGMNTTKSVVHYISAEDGIHASIRRIAAEMDTVGATGSPLLRVHNATPRIDTSLGYQELRARVFSEILWQELGQIATKHFPLYSEKEKELPETAGDFYSNNPKEMQRFLEKENLTPSEQVRVKMLSILEDLYLCYLDPQFSDEFRSQDPNSKPVYISTEDDYLENWSPPAVLIIDTYSATAADDEKSTVATYHRHLRQLQQEIKQEHGGPLTVIIADHFTKGGDTFMGSLAKEGDVDAMLFMKRRGDIARLTCEKMRSAPHFPPITITAELFDTRIPSPDEEGKTLTTLVLRDGKEKQRRLDIAGSETAAVILELVDESGGEIEREELRDAFIQQQIETDPEKKVDSLRRQFNRAISKMMKAEQVEELDGMILMIPDE
jgi:hypothetical protein